MNLAIVYPAGPLCEAVAVAFEARLSPPARLQRIQVAPGVDPELPQGAQVLAVLEARPLEARAVLDEARRIERELGGRGRLANSTLVLRCTRAGRFEALGHTTFTPPQARPALPPGVTGPGGGVGVGSAGVGAGPGGGGVSAGSLRPFDFRRRVG